VGEVEGMNDLDETAGVVPDEYVKAYFEDDAIITAVNDLVNQFNSAKLHPSSMDENISIAQATAYAAQTRSSFIVFCTQLWKATWGEALVGKRRKVKDFPSHRDVWTSRLALGVGKCRRRESVYWCDG